MTTTIKTALVLGVSALVLTGCANTNNTMNDFNTREAGAEIDTGFFGNATMNNVSVHNGASSFMINLNRRFAEEVNTTVNFAFNSTVLDEQARATLRLQADWIRQFPEVRFKVYGHTDLVGSTAYNRQLGLRRAEAAVLYLSSQGIDRSRLEAVVTFGETQPLIVTEGRERRNRRTVTEVSGFVQNHPTVLDGQYGAIIFRDYVSTGVSEAQGPRNSTDMGHSNNLPGGGGT